MRNLKIKNNESGRSMIEMLGVLAIIGVLSVGGIAGYSKAMMEYRINKTIEQITLIAGNVRTFFAPQGNYAGLDSSSDTGKAIIKKAKLVPDEMLTLDSDGNISAITNAFDGSFHIGTLGSDNHKGFAFYISKIPEEACIELFSKDWSELKVSHLCNNGVTGPAKCVIPPADFDKILILCNGVGKTGITLYFEVANCLSDDCSIL